MYFTESYTKYIHKTRPIHLFISSKRILMGIETLSKQDFGQVLKNLTTLAEDPLNFVDKTDSDGNMITSMMGHQYKDYFKKQGGWRVGFEGFTLKEIQSRRRKSRNLEIKDVSRRIYGKSRII